MQEYTEPILTQGTLSTSQSNTKKNSTLSIFVNNSGS